MTEGLTFILTSFYIIISMIIKHLINIESAVCFRPRQLCDLFGIGSIVSGVVGAGAQIGATAMANSANRDIAESNNETALQIHREDNAFNAAESEKARQFNAAESEKARQWQSEQAVMQRRAEAGLNTAVLDGTVTPSSAEASGPSAVASSAPSLATPTMQPPNIAGAISDVTDATIKSLKAPSEIAKTESDTGLTDAQKETTKAQREEIQTNILLKQIEAAYKPSELSLALASARQGLREKKFNVDVVLPAIANKYNTEAYNITFGGIMQMQSQDIHLQELLQNYDAITADMELKAEIALRNWKAQGLRDSWYYGDQIKNMRNNNTMSSSNWMLGLNMQVGGEMGFHADASASVNSLPLYPASGGVSAGVNGSISGHFGGNYQYGKGHQIIDNRINTLYQRFQNTQLWNQVMDTLSASILLRTSKTYDERVRALQRLGRVTDYVKRYMQVKDMVSKYSLLNDKPNQPVRLPAHP